MGADNGEGAISEMTKSSMLISFSSEDEFDDDDVDEEESEESFFCDFDGCCSESLKNGGTDGGGSRFDGMFGIVAD